MSEIYDMAILAGDVVVLVLFFYLVTQTGLIMMEYFAYADARIIQEYMSGVVSMSNFAPNFYALEFFPKVTHQMRVFEERPIINIIVGQLANETNVLFEQKAPLPYIYSNDITGNCVGEYCLFSEEHTNNITIESNGEKTGIGLNSGEINVLLPSYSCLKISGQTCELASSCPIGKTSGSGTCETGKVCCKPIVIEDIVMVGSGGDIVI